MAGNVLDWDWNNAIFIDGEITDDLVTKLAPEILRLKQTDPASITVGIDSPGGSIAASGRLLTLLKSPGPSGKSPTVITIAINKAYSAAASLLALGDYAVALPSAQIHYHDVRYSTFYDLTSSKAVEAARELKRENDRMALRLANSVVQRFSWIFIDLSRNFGEARNQHPELVAKVSGLGLDDIWAATGPKLDFAGFICSQSMHTSLQGDAVIADALQKLKDWRSLELAHAQFSSANDPSSDTAALFRDDNPLISAINSGGGKDAQFTWAHREGLQKDLVLLMLLLLRKAATVPALRVNEETIAELMSDYAFFQEIRRKDHVDTAVKVILEHDYILFDAPLKQQLQEAKSDAEREALIAIIFPQGQIFWAYIVLLCRSLLEGEHPMSLEDALFLGLIDEIPGRRYPETRRSIRNKRIAKEQATQVGGAGRKWPRSRLPRK